MTTTPPDPTEAASPTSATAPPPGCPAHGLDADGIARLYGAEHEADAMGMYERLRKEHGAVAPVLLEGDLPAWLVLDYREILEVTRTPSRFSRDTRLWRDLKEGNVPPNSPLLPVMAWQPVCVFTEGQEHERLRVAVTDSMGRFDRRGIRRHVTRFANQLIDEFSASGQADIVKDFAEHLPMLVMTQLLGMPDDYGPRLVQASRDLIQGTGETAAASNEFVVETLQAFVKRKRAVPGHDFASWLMAHPSKLTDDEVVQHLRIVLIAAYESTVSLIGNTMRMVLTDRRFRASLAGGHMTIPDAVEQVLWDEPPFKVIPGRCATGDTELAGQHISEGDMVLIGLAAGNLDPAVRPDLAVPVHGNRSHLAFSGGPHECPGQDIGRAITDTGVDTLLARLPDIQLAGSQDDLSWVSSLLCRRLVTLPVKFQARPPSSTPEAGEAANTEEPVNPTVAQTTPAPSADANGTHSPNAAAPTSGTRRSWWASLKRWLGAR